MKRKAAGVSSSSDGSAPPEKLCPSWIWLITNFGSIYAVDINQRNPPVQARRKLDNLVCKLDDLFPEYGMGIISLGKKFYMFGGLCGATMRPCADVYICDTSLVANPRCYNYPKYLFRRGPPMHGPKVGPIVVAISGKIYVLAYNFQPFDPLDVCSCPSPRFEVFDPANESWSILSEPNILPGDDRRRRGFCSFGNPRTDEDYKIRSYLVSGSDLIVSTNRRGMFQYNTETDVWKHIIAWGGLLELPFGHLQSYNVDGTWSGWCVPSSVGAFQLNAEDGHLIQKDSLDDYNDFDTDGLYFLGPSLVSHLFGQTMCYVEIGRPHYCDQCSLPPEPYLFVNVFEVGKQSALKGSRHRYFQKKSSDAYLMVDSSDTLERISACIHISK